MIRHFESFERIRLFEQVKLRKFRAQVTYIYAFDGHSKFKWKDVTIGNYFRKSLLVIDYHNGVIDYIVTSEELWLFAFEIWIFKH